MCDNSKSVKPFDGVKYSIWRSRIRAMIDEVIIDENALSIVDAQNRPENIPEAEWLRRNKVAKGLIIRNLADSVVSVATSEPGLTARQIFLNLDNLFMRQSLATQLATDMKLYNFKYDENSTLSQHFMLFNELIAEWESASGDKMKEMGKIARLLSSLPKAYSPLKVAIQTLSDENLSLAFVKVRLLEYEIQLDKETSDTNLKVLQTINANENYKKIYKRKFIQNKFKKTGFKNKIRCHFCNKIGHIKKNCFKFIKEHKDNKNNENENTIQMVNSGIAFMCGENSDGASFIIDSGASDHIINNEELYESYEVLQPSVKIAVAKNNTFIEATKRGQVKLVTDKNTVLLLKDVLLCKEVPNNILSVRRMQAADLVVVFNKSKVVITKGGETIYECKNMNGVPKVKFNLCNREINNVNSVEGVSFMAQ